MRIFLALLAPGFALAAGAGIDFRTAVLPPAILHKPYSPPPLVAMGGGRCVPNIIGFDVIEGRLPKGISLSPAGVFSGMPEEEGVYSLLVRAQNECISYSRKLVLRVEGPPILELSPERLEFHYQPGTALPAAQSLHVSANVPDLAYSIESEGAAWLELRPARGRTPPDGSALRHDMVEVAVDPLKLKPGEYRVRVRAEAWQAANSPSAWITIRITGREWQ